MTSLASGKHIPTGQWTLFLYMYFKLGVFVKLIYEELCIEITAYDIKPLAVCMYGLNLYTWPAMCIDTSYFSSVNHNCLII